MIRPLIARSILAALCLMPGLCRAATLYYADPDAGDYRVTGILFDDGRQFEIRNDSITPQQVLDDPNRDYVGSWLVDYVNAARIPVEAATVLPLDGYQFASVSSNGEIWGEAWFLHSALPHEEEYEYVRYNDWQIWQLIPYFDQWGNEIPLLQTEIEGFAYSVLPQDVTTLSADFDDDGEFTAADIDVLNAAIRSGEYDARFDFWLNGSLEASDREGWFEYVIPYSAGDANLDGQFGPSDLILALASGEFEDEVPVNSTWATGDWNGDAEFDSTDLIEALATGTYNRPAAAVAIPEPATWLLALLGVLALTAGRLRQST